MSREENKTLNRRLIDEAWNQGKIEVVDAILAHDYVHHEPTAPERRNRDDYKRHLIGTRITFPDFQIRVDDELADDDRVVTRWTVTGTHQGNLDEPSGTITPTERQIIVTGITIARYAHGKLVEEWQVADMLSFTMQLGLSPAPVQVGR